MLKFNASFKGFVFAVLLIFGFTNNINAQAKGLIRAYVFLNPTPDKAVNLTKQAKQILENATKKPGFVSANILESVSGKEQTVLSVLWNSPTEYKQWLDSTLKKLAKSTVKTKGKKNVRVAERRLAFNIANQYIPESGVIKNYKVNDYASLTYWTINKELEDLFTEKVVELFGTSKKEKGFHFGEYGVDAENGNTLICISYWDSKESSLNALKQTKLKIKRKQKMSLVSTELLEKLPENKRYKVVYVK